MSTVKVQGSAAIRIGQGLGRGVAAVLRLEKALWSSLGRAGIPALVVTAVKWSARVAFLGAGALLATWGLLQLLGLLAIIAIGIGIFSSPSIQQGSQSVNFDLDANKATKIEVREGLDGYGTYVGSHRVE
ncbi:DUF3742 family protein [Pseudomonas syringae pv. tagetis]|uniref:DUF3742 family protein n=1 Tax=Pseudomonas syringae pv. tagetis TaxID=129140 RepID=A0A0Q0B5U6_9PSED|nr:DUF3742 family protein [Pseudomonas syringae group genomosp. 7]KPY86234.1 Uncharacterized protein ALO44_01761 [Pseudomonas syringae pv. tagetis]RMW08554.1 hypothetical protein ALO98_200233 [Pseudomonas syringae pv. tagetis]RMW14433.1 hypothetical protein ALO97_01628 [Pseudomonas syringae pv. tagetis]UNB69320.1 DUF3742 family protein [Pseudomonas syringae pv. tagetis]